MTMDYEVAQKKLVVISAKRKEADELMKILEHQLLLGTIWPEAFEGGQKCSGILVGSSTDARIVFRREDGKERVFYLRELRHAGVKGRHMIYTDPMNIIPDDFIDRIQKCGLPEEERYWVEYNRARFNDTTRLARERQDRVIARKQERLNESLENQA